MLSLHKLEIFVRVVRCGSFSAAAEFLYMSQPAVSQHIQDLEASLGVKLFERAGARGVKVTDAGQELFDYSQRILQLVTEAENKITRVENLEAGQITIGVTQDVGNYLISDWLSQFGSRYPNLTVALQTGITNVIAEHVLAERIQLGFVEGELDMIQDEQLSSLEITDVAMLLVVGQKHKWYGQNQISIQDMEGQPFITRQPRSRTRIWTDGIFVRSGVKPRIVAEFDSTESIKSSAISGLGSAILPSFSVAREIDMGLLHAIQIDGLPLRRQLKLVWNNQVPFNPIVCAFLGTLTPQFPHLDDIL